MEAEHPVRNYLALGDSYTIGEGVIPEHSFPYQLGAQLLQQGIAMAPPEIVAKTGWTTGELISAINELPLLSKNYHLVTLLIGVNNQYRELPQENYRLEFRELLQRSVAFAGGNRERVVVLSIPDWGVTPFASALNRAQIPTEIDAFNGINREEALHAGIAYANITGISRQAQFDAKLIAPDGLHPSGKMYQQWVRVVLPEAVRALNNR